MAAAVPYRSYLLRRLSDPAVAAAYLNAAVKKQSRAAFLQALRNVVDANGGITNIAARADLNRQALYRMLSDDGNPEFRSLQSVLEAAGLELNVVTAEQKRAGYSTAETGRARTKRKRRSPRSRMKLAA